MPIQPAPAGSRYVDQRPYVIAPDLDELRGPTRGSVSVDHWLAWSGKSTFDLDDDRQVVVLYETMLLEATSAVDLARWLDGATLVRLWPTLVLPPRLRAQWESRSPDLSRG